MGTKTIHLWMLISMGLMPSVLSGCTTGGDEDEARQDVSVSLIELGRDDFEQELVNQLEPGPLLLASGLSPEDGPEIASRMVDEMESSIAACMAELGLPYETHVIADDLGETWLPPLSRRDFAAEYGFGSTLDPTSDSPIGGLVAEDPNVPYLDTLDADELEVWENSLFGENGCAASAATGVLGESGVALDALVREAQAEVTSHVAVRQAADDYVRCTASEGYPWLNNPWNARLIGVEYAREQELPKDEEIAAANAELQCRYEAVRVARSVQAEVERRLVEENAEVLSTMREQVGA